ncbi:hypothetical protein DID88_008959 [Monilinia fructigena]|uniref:Uncharacterized protein n=1 Tax=Monilinia fructigena TaxID=38457 RepID=A0A395JBZ0_9HELO|nr:hypothetical protein DID88_008959 [Monilinia fructigena]
MLAAQANAIPDTLNPSNFALELVPSQSDTREEFDSDPSVVNNNGDNGLLLLGLLLANQSNNKPAACGTAVDGGGATPDTLDPRHIALEQISSQNPLQKTNDFSSSKTYAKDGVPSSSTSGEDGPLIFALNIALESKAPVDDGLQSNKRLDDGEDGPLLLSMLLVNQNNNPNLLIPQADPIADTLDPGSTVLELEASNQNQEAAADCSISDTLYLKHAALELNLHTNDAEVTNGRHGPLNFSPSLNESNYKLGDTITKSIPDFTEIKSQLLKSHSHGGIITKAVPRNLIKPPIIKDANLKSLSGVSVTKPHVTPNYTNEGRLNDEQLQFWKDNGYLVISNALSTVQKALLLKIVHGAAETLALGGAFKPGTEPLKRIQRLGCGIHRVIPAFRKAILTPLHTELAKSLGYKDLRIIQSLIIVKAAEVGTRVIPHQDGCSGFTDPSSCTTFWYALEDCTTENGCLAVAPGSHRTQPITQRCRMDKDGRPEFYSLDRPVFAEIGGVSDTAPLGKNENGELQYKKLEVKAGSLVLMHGNLMHTSEANHSSKSRVVFNFNVVEGELDWLADNYLQPYEGEMEFEKLNVK